MTVSGLRLLFFGLRAAGSKKYSAALVATALTLCPAFFSESYRPGVRMAATEPVTPSSTLAMALLVFAFQGGQQFLRQLAAADALISALHRPQVCPVS